MRAMLNVFTLTNGRLVQQEDVDSQALSRMEPVWIDLESPTSRELGWVQARFGLDIPADVLDQDLEESARFYEEEELDQLHLRSDFLINDDARPRNERVAFIVHRGVLFSIHTHDLTVFRLLRLRARRMPGMIENAIDVLLALYLTDAEFSADVLEGVYDALEDISSAVIRPGATDQDASRALTVIAQQEDVNGRIRRNVMDTRRALSFLLRSRRLNADQMQEARQILRDIDSLDGHTAFLFDKINFLMDATVGFININQNKVIKIFSVASVAMLPPTLIASIYGMNFKVMPELDWTYGYPFALGLMVLTVIAPFWYFRKKGWLH
jgi:magnesium transporter